MDNRIEIDIVLNDGTIARGLLRAEQQAEVSGRRIGDNIEDGVRRGAGNAFNGLRAAIVGIGAALAGVFAAREIIEASSRQQDAINSLNQSLRNAGEFSTQASEDFQKFASDLQSTSIIGDEQILEVAALARNFTRTNEEAQKLTEAAVELSAATGKSLESSITNLGKTFGGLTGELGETVPALRELTAEQLKAGEALDFVLGRFGGSALAQTQTFSGATRQLSNTFGDLLENFGNLITRSPTLVRAINFVTDQLKTLGDSVPEGDLFAPFLEGLIGVGLGINQFVIAPFNGVIAVTKVLIDAVFLIGSAFSAVLTGIPAAINNLLLQPVLEAGRSVATLAGFFDKDLAESINNGISGIQTGLNNGLSSGFDASLNATRASFELLTEDLTDLANVGGSDSAESFLNGLRTSLAEVDTTTLLPDLGGGDRGPAGEVEDTTTTIKADVVPVLPTPAAVQSFNQQLTTAIQAPLNSALNDVGESILGAGESFTSVLSSIQAGTASFAQSFRASLAVGAVRALQTFQNAGAQAFAQFASDLANGEARLQDFGKVIFSLIGDVLFQLGTQLIAAGIGNLIAFNFALGSAQIAGGTAVAAAGGFLKAQAGESRGSASSAVSTATAGGGGVSNGQIGNIDAGDGAINLGDTRQSGRQANIEVNIQGNVLDRRETALEIIEVLEEAQFAGIEVAV